MEKMNSTQSEIAADGLIGAGLDSLPVPETVSGGVGNLLNSQTVRQIIKFIIIGAMNTFVDLVVLNFLAYFAGYPKGLTFAMLKTLSFLSAAAFSYYANSRWTFRSPDLEKKNRFPAFLTASIAGMVLNITAATLVITYLAEPVNRLLEFSFLTDSVWINISALAGTACGLLWNFTVYKYIVFRIRPENRQ